MQIDFHHTTTYVIARHAGFNHNEAEIIAYCAQYVDDATSEGTVFFDNKAVYNRISSAHKMLDKRNIKALANHQVWMTFHFLPGNDNLAAGQNPDGSFIEKIICRPNSYIAQDMVRSAIDDQNKKYSLHRLGVAMHVYADTWAHKGFAGVLHPVNDVEDAEEIGDTHVFGGGLKSWLRDQVEDVIPPLGHGRAMEFPDMPFLSWKYKNGRGDRIQRNNTDDFCEAANEMCKAMQRYRAKNPLADVTGLQQNDMNKIHDMFTRIKEKEGAKRHQKWLDAIADGYFSFGAQKLEYSPRGSNSWKALSLGTSYDLPVHKYDKSFLDSHWKMFHDAIQAHRFHVIHDVLPHYGICAA